MKRIFFSIILILVLILVIVLITISNNNIKNSKTLEFNKQFEKYLDKTMYGTEVLTIINKAIDNNEKNGVDKDEDGFYIENNTSSIKVELTLLSTNEEGEIVEVKHQMERLQKAGLDKFIASFNLTEFKCTNIEYNEESKVSKIYLKQLEL